MMIGRFEGMLMMERPKALEGGRFSEHVKAHGKSARTQTTGRSLCLHPGFASAPYSPTSASCPNSHRLGYGSDDFFSKGL